MQLSVDIRVTRPDFSLDITHEFALGGITALFGPSGVGKSTLLRIISGFESESSGRVAFGDEVWQDGSHFVSPHKRGVGYVFQDTRLFPHLKVSQNLNYAVKRSPSDSQIGFDSVVKTLDLGSLLNRRTESLSGGESQRVAIGRTLLSGPRLLLMDEPLAALDHARKASLLPYIACLPKAFSLPVIYVTHSIEEVTRLADQMVVLADGGLLASGDVAKTLARLDIAEASGRFEAGSVVKAVVTGQDDAFKLTQLIVAGQPLTMPASAVERGENLRLRIRARDVAIALHKPEGISIRNILQGTVIEIEQEAETAFAEILLDLGEGQHLRARITRASVAELDLAVGRVVQALIKSVSFDRRALPKG